MNHITDFWLLWGIPIIVAIAFTFLFTAVVYGWFSNGKP